MGLFINSSLTFVIDSINLSNIEALNEVEDYAFYENFNTKTKEPNGVPKCTWSASGQIILSQYLKGKKLLK